MAWPCGRCALHVLITSNAKCKVQKRLLVNNATPPQAVMVWLIPSQLSDSGTGVESLLWSHSDERHASTPWACLRVVVVWLDFLVWRPVVAFYGGLVQTAREGAIAASGGAEGPSTTILAKCFGIRSKFV